MTSPFSDLRVISIEQYGAGPFGTMQLADLGAEVIKIEDPSAGGDVARYVPPFSEGGTSLFFESFNRNKRSVALDLRQAAGRKVLEDLVARADALTSNLRGDQPEKLRIRYDDLKHINPKIVCVSLSAFGMTGPRAAQGGYDFTMQGIAGWMQLTGGPDQPPTKSGLSLVDYCSGYVAAIAVLAGVWQARRDGFGCDADLSLFDTALAQLTYVGTWIASRDFEPPRMASSAHLSVVPFQTFDTADGRIVIACPKDQLWRRLCVALDRPDLAADQRFASFESRQEYRGDLVRELSQELSARLTAELLTLFEEHGVPCGAVNTAREALRDPQTEDRRSVASYEHSVLGTVQTVASPLRLSTVERRLEAGPLLGEHTREVLAEICGYDEEELDRLHREGVIGAEAPASSPP
jgi:crotonobetainyl-CoA:carnitine CoA-transferase CaiB-like acyl-CoA transferase